MNKKLKMIALTSAVLAFVACKKDEAAKTPPVEEAKVVAPVEPEKVIEETPATTEAVLDHHLASFGAGKVDDILADYADDAVVVTPMGTMKGKEALKPMFEGMVKEFAQPDTKFKMDKKMVNGELGFITWSAETATNTYELATDTFLVVDGKIVAQTFAGKITPKAAPEGKEEAAKDAAPAEGPTQAVLGHHLTAFGERNIENILADFTAESVFLSPMGELVGADALKPVFEGMFAEFAKKGVKFTMGKMIVEGEIALITWSAETPDNSYEWATDTFVIRDGKIVYQTMAAKVTPKKG